jgi:hypothetical protein
MTKTYTQKDGTIWSWDESETLKEYIKSNSVKSNVTDNHGPKTSK